MLYRSKFSITTIIASQKRGIFWPITQPSSDRGLKTWSICIRYLGIVSRHQSWQKEKLNIGHNFGKKQVAVGFCIWNRNYTIQWYNLKSAAAKIICLDDSRTFNVKDNFNFDLNSKKKWVSTNEIVKIHITMICSLNFKIECTCI